jgi:hypothetical protein
MNETDRTPRYKRILQIIPATGWHVLLEEPADGGAPRREAVPLAVWALVETDDGAQGIVGLASGELLTPATGHRHFRGYEHESQRAHRVHRAADVAPVEADDRPL